MRFSARSKVGILLSLVTILTLISAFAVTTFMGRGTATQAAHSTHSVKYHGRKGSAVRHSMHVTKAVNHTLTKHTAKFSSAGGRIAKSKVSSKVAARSAARVAAADASAVLSPRVNEGGILQNFAGLTSTDSALLNNFAVIPPDQGLCAGHDATIPPSFSEGSNPKVEFEMINLAIAEYDTTGDPLTSDILPFGTDNLNNFFFEPALTFDVFGNITGGEFTSDPNCVFDKASNTFYFEIVALDLRGGATLPQTFTESHNDLVVYNASSGLAAEYQFDTSDLGAAGCPLFPLPLGCLADQGKLGIDNHAVYISSDEFQNNLFVQNGAELLAINKTDLLAGVTNPINLAGVAEFDYFTNIVDPTTSVPITSLQPAASVSSSNVEYLVNSFPFLDSIQNANPFSESLGFWTVTHDEDIPNSDVTLTGTDIASEEYAFNVPAASTGDGTAFAATIQNNDDRLMQCEFISGNVWCSLDTSVTIPGDPTTRDGVAWFKINASSQTVSKQGYVASSHNNLLFPSIFVTKEGTVTIVFSITGPNLNPSAAYVVRKSGAKHFGSIHRAFTAQSPSFAGDGNVRWGDYSRAALDLNGKDFWLATEYSFVPTAFEVFFGLPNDGTRVFEVMGDH